MAEQVLLVERNLTVAGLIAQTLRRTVPNLSIAYVSTTTQALDFVFGTGRYEDRNSQQIPDLVLLSLDFPNRDGHELFRILRSYIRTRAIPMVLLTEEPGQALELVDFELKTHTLIEKCEHPEQFARAMASAATYWLNAHSSEGTENKSLVQLAS